MTADAAQSNRSSRVRWAVVITYFMSGLSETGWEKLVLQGRFLLGWQSFLDGYWVRSWALGGDDD